MSFYPNAKLLLIPESATQKTIVPRAIILHSAGGKGSLHNFWLNSSDLECHFWISSTGDVEQYMNTTTRADANLGANNFAISIETESTVNATEPWTEAQVKEIVKLCDWLCTTHNIPRSQIQSPEGSGIGWHIMFGTPGPWTPTSKVCPGPKRIEQTKNVIIPAVAKLEQPSQEDFLANMDPKEQKELIDKINGTALQVDAIFKAMMEDPKAPKGNLFKRIRDSLARIENKAA